MNNEQNFGTQGKPGQVEEAEKENLTDEQREMSEERENQIIKEKLLEELNSITFDDENIKNILTQAIEKLSLMPDREQEILKKDTKGKYTLGNVELPYSHEFKFMGSDYRVRFDTVAWQSTATDFLKKNGMPKNDVLKIDKIITGWPDENSNDEKIEKFFKNLTKFISKKEEGQILVSGSRDKYACYVVDPEKAWFYGLIVNNTQPHMDAIKEYCEGNNLDLREFVLKNKDLILKSWESFDEDIKKIRIAEMEKIIGENKE